MVLRRVAAVFVLSVVSLSCDQVNPSTVKTTSAAAVPLRVERRVDPPAPLPPVRPNILLITLDTLRYDATGLAPEGTNRTPFLRQIAANGVEFTHSYSTFDNTPESHFSMLTGFVSGWGVQPFDVKEHSVAYQLSRHGYSTFAVVANGNLSQALNYDTRPFDSFVCLWDVWEKLPEEEKREATRAVDARIDHYHAPANDFNQGFLYASADRVIRRFETSLAKAKPPFFGFLNFIDAHDPYFPDPAGYDADAEESGIRPEGFVSDLRTRPLPKEVLDPSTISDEKRRAEVTEALKAVAGRPWSLSYDLDGKALRIYKKRYRAEVRELDRAVRRLFDILAEKKLLDSTVVIITSDHGESFGEKHMITHSMSNQGDREATHRVPLIIGLPPAYNTRNRTVDAPTSSADIAPTIYELAGLDWSKIGDKALPGRFGRSLVPFFGATFTTRLHALQAEAATLSEKELAATRKKAEQRLRALGYLN